MQFFWHLLFEILNIKKISFKWIIPKMYLFYYKLGFIILPHIAKVMKEKNSNSLLSSYDFVFTNLLKMRQSWYCAAERMRLQGYQLNTFL